MFFVGTPLPHADDRCGLAWPIRDRSDSLPGMSNQAALPTRKVLRPVQYLGNKQRSLGSILPHVASAVDSGDTVADLFTGTSVVAQGMASLGLDVLALDVSPACATMARATLGVDRRSGDCLVTAFEAVTDVAQESLHQLTTAFGEWLEAEDRAIRAADGRELLALGRFVPQVWRRPRCHRLTELFASWNAAAGAERASLPLLTPVFAGTYLGVRQALTLDAYRFAVSESLQRGLLSSWQADATVTSLLSAASSAAFTAGKHFANPLADSRSCTSAFHHCRILADRSVDVATHSRHFLNRVAHHARQANESHQVIEAPVDSVTAEMLRAQKVRLVYADPPYTAQQYSRFYHLLDVYAQGWPRPLQRVRGRITKGLYPIRRYMSPFCRKTQAAAALRRLTETCRDAEATLLLSYSLSARRSTGNERMLSLDTLISILAASYGRPNLSVAEFNHRYRQFNASHKVRATRDDPEILVTAHAA